MLVCVVGALLFLALRTPAPARTSLRALSPSQEIIRIKTQKTTAEQSVELTKLLERVGPLEAQEELLRSGLPFTGETHLLVHTIGNYVYDEYGSEGLSYCKDYFLSACYHAFILNTLGDHGMTGMVEVMEHCNKAGPGVYPQCSHGAGHGFTAWHDYDLVKALEMCDELGGKSPNFPHFNCYDGVFMENIWGVHDGAPSPKRWIKESDIHYPCNDSRIPEKYLKGCWSNQATLIYQHYKGDLRKTALACDAVANSEYRDTCYNNWARQIHPLTQGKLDKVFSLCAIATGDARKNQCIFDNMSAYWSVGDRQIPFSICFALQSIAQDECYKRLASMINFYYAAKPTEKKFYCAKITNATYRNQCED